MICNVIWNVFFLMIFNIYILSIIYVFIYLYINYPVSIHARNMDGLPVNVTGDFHLNLYYCVAQNIL